ncbi:hypothetical protein BaRGS_00000834, partial [Batillaria attramentaria]
DRFPPTYTKTHPVLVSCREGEHSSVILQFVTFSAMKTSAVFLLVLFGLAFSQSLPQKCCFSKKLEAMLTDLTTIKSNQISLVSMALDFERQMEVRLMYEIRADDPTHCNRRTLTWPLPDRCVPDDAEYLGSTYLGPVNSLPYDSWRYRYTGTQANMTMAFSTQGCVPILESLVGDLGFGPVDFTYLFTTVKQDIEDPSVFNIPRSCNQVDAPENIG